MLFSWETEYDTKVPEELRLAQDVLNLLAGFTVNLTSCPKLAIEFGKTGLIPVFLGMTEALKDCIPDIIPFEVEKQNQSCYLKISSNSLHN